jgi:hypothetical protein
MQFDEKHRKNLSISGSAYRQIQRDYEKVHGKKCSDCKEIKPVAEFDFLNRERESRVSVCKLCKKIRFATWYQTDSAKESNHRRYVKHYSTEKRKLTSRITMNNHRAGWYAELLKRGLNKCSVCGYDKNTGALDLHHINEKNKLLNLSACYSRAFNEKRYGAELDKCICLCANCHRELHSPHKNHTMQEFIDNPRINLHILETMETLNNNPVCTQH